MAKSDGAARGTFQRQLILGWVKQHRPDVVIAATKEAEKKYPRAARAARVEVTLPPSLKDLR